MKRRTFIGSIGASLAAQSAVRAQAPAAKAATIVVGFAPGGSVDLVARLVAEQMQRQLGRVFIVDNKTGAAGRLAPELVKLAAPDGQTLMIVPHGPMTLFPYIYKQLRFDPVTDFTPIARLIINEYALLAAPNVAARDAAGLKRWILEDKSHALYGSPGAGTVPHFIGVSVAQALGVEMAHVPYRGAAPALSDLAAGTIPFVSAPLSDALPLIQAGKVRVVATGGQSRSRNAPEAPTFQEIGIDVALPGWYAMYGPARMPAALVAELQDAARGAVLSSGLQERLVQMGVEAAPTTSAELRALQAAETLQWKKIVAASGFTPSD